MLTSFVAVLIVQGYHERVPLWFEYRPGRQWRPQLVALLDGGFRPIGAGFACSWPAGVERRNASFPIDRRSLDLAAVRGRERLPAGSDFLIFWILLTPTIDELVTGALRRAWPGGLSAKAGASLVMPAPSARQPQATNPSSMDLVDA